MPIDPEKSTVVNKGGDFPRLAEGQYAFELVDLYMVENVKTPFFIMEKDKKTRKLDKEGNPIPKFINQIYAFMSVLEGEDRGMVIVHFLSDAFTAGFEGGSSSKLYDLSCAVTGEILDDKEPFDINSLVEGVFKGKVAEKESKTGSVYTRIVAVRQITKDVDKLSKKELEIARTEAKERFEALTKGIGVGEEDLSDKELEDIGERV